METTESIVFEISRWEKQMVPLGCILEIEISKDMGLDDIEEIISGIENLPRGDKTIFFIGMKYASEPWADQAHVSVVFSTQDVSLDTAPTGSSGELCSDKLHNKAKEEPKKDPFDDILRIFNKK